MIAIVLFVIALFLLVVIPGGTLFLSWRGESGGIPEIASGVWVLIALVFLASAVAKYVLYY
jgi:hypothetical protein